MLCNAGMNTAIERAIEHCGGATKLAQLLGVTAQRLNNWVARGVPIEHCSAVEKATHGAVRRWDLRPDDWHRIWPELIGTDGAPTIPQELAHG